MAQKTSHVNPDAQTSALLNEAVAFHRAGRLAEAEALYRQVLAISKDNPNAWNLMGTIMQARGQAQVALQYFQNALKASPHFASAHFNMGNLLAGLGREPEAEAAYRQAILVQPTFADALLNLGSLLYRQGQLESAIQTFKDLTLRCPAYERGYYNLGRCLRQAKSYGEAEAAFKAALTLAPETEDTSFALAQLYADTNRLELALDVIRALITKRPANGEYVSSLGAMLSKLRRYDEAIAAHTRACDIDPKRAEFKFNLGTTLFEAGQLSAAAAAFEDATLINPNYAQAYVNWGEVLKERGDLERAIVIFDRALAIGSEHDESLRDIRDAAILNRSLSLLSAGEFRQGWAAYRDRFAYRKSMFTPRVFSLPEWKGEPATDKSLLLWSDQGIGDEILYSVMVPEAQKKTKACLLECADRLVPLFRRSFPGVHVVARTDPPAPEINSFQAEVQSSITDLGGIFRNDRASFPKHTGYLVPDAGQVRSMRRRYADLAGPKRIVGISWRSASPGTGDYKTLPLNLWEPILKSPGYFFVSLQYGSLVNEMAASVEKTGVPLFQDHEVDPLNDLDLFAAQVAAMDLVISVSNTTVHFAGALNVPVWTLVPKGKGALWYFSEGETSPWYPAMKLIRQPNPGDWNTVVDRVAAELRPGIPGRHSS